MMLPVYLERCLSYSPDGLYKIFDDLLGRTFTNQSGFHGKTVLLKPNLITARAPSFACTHPDFVAEAARWFVDRGALVKVGDSPAFGTARGVMKQNGILDRIEAVGAEAIEFKKTRRFVLADGTKVDLAAAPFECDHLINLPKLKAHNQMYVTLAAKNLFGLVKGHKKAMLHISHGSDRAHFSKMLLELIDLLPEKYTLVDGVVAMHKAGPIKGEKIQLGCIASGSDPLAIDTALLKMLRLDIHNSPLIREAKKQGRKSVDIAGFSFPKLTPEDIDGSGFVAPVALNPITFHPLKMVYSRMKRMVMSLTS